MLLLCDHAAVADGKLYINGGGWSQTIADRPVHVGIAAKIEVPWDQTNVQHDVKIKLVTEDGHAVLNADSQEVGAEATLEVGRPAGLPHGVALDVPVALNFPGITVPEGGYRWVLRVDEDSEASVSFRAVKGGS